MLLHIQSSMFGKVVRNLCRRRSGRTLVAGAIGVLTAAQVLLSVSVSQPVIEVKAEPAPASPAKPRIKISQTRSELGYVYWVVRETGAETTFALFDTWQEAMDEAARRMNAANEKAEQSDDALVTA